MELSFVICGLFLLGVNSVGTSDVKSSLTFVIDDTGSMSDDIAQVKLGANAIFDTVMKSNSSQIEDFVLVTFNDPDVKLRTITKDREAFKTALRGITVDGGADCPEMSMGGIELALQKSREGSVLYVFTDAAAKDLNKYDEVEALSHKSGSQIVFVLTGICSTRTAPDYLVYHKIAKATNGAVFHLQRREIGEILKYVENTIENRKNVITSKTFPAGYGNTFDVVVDGDMKELVIAVSGESPSVGVTDSGGTKWPTTDITRLSEVAIVKVVGVKPDVYKVEVGSKSNTHVVVSGSTSVHFQHGFSIIRPSTISDTVKRPVPGEKSHLSIKLAAEGDVVLHSVQILDMDDNVIVEKPLKLVNKADQFYTTTDLVVPPNHIFRVAIKGYDHSRKSHLTRISLTPVKPQDVKIATVKTKAPVVNIDGSPKIEAEYDKPLQLKCRVSGYPKPSVIWESDDKSATLSHSVSTVELPYDYVSVLDVNNVKKNATYICKAVNTAGNGEGSIDVQTKITTFFNVVALPEDMTIEYQKEHQIQCKADALPPASVTWYKDSRPLRLDGNMDLSAHGSTLTIRSMEPYMAGDYLCEMRNSVGRKIASFKVDISGVESPEIRKDTDHVIAMKHSKAYIQCQVVKGHPKPTMHWLYKGATDEEFNTLNETTDTIHFDKVQATNAGAYRCIAESDVDWDHHEIELIVEYKPTISRELNSSLTANQGDTLTLLCAADGVPTPDITWRHNGAPLRSRRHTFFRDGSLRFTATLSDKGVYECEAKNVHGVDSIRIDVDIIVPVDIESPKNSIMEQKVGSPVVLPCRADGSPKPRIMWVYRSKDDKLKPRIFSPTDASGELRFPMIQQPQGGSYTCVATNSGGSKNITYEVSVLAPPSIRYTAKQFRAVVDDMQLRIPCEATGNPKPDITWSNNGYSLASGSIWFDISADGSLIIKNVDKKSQGSYICTASNALGIKSEGFNVIVDEYPRPGFLSSSIMIEEGTTATIPCSVPQKKTDRLRWFKDGRLVSDSELELLNVRQSDSGTYTCRVSFVDRPARSGSTKVEVGYKPQFSYLDDEKNISFQKEVTAYMDCTATGNPEPEVKWFHDGKEIGFTGFQYEFEMTNTNQKGRYTCEVSNRFGTVQQEYVISSSECSLDIKSDFNDNEPLMLTPYDTFSNFESSDGYLHIPKDEMIKLSCPSGFNAIPSTDINVICETKTQFILEPTGIHYAYSDLKCRDKLQPSVKRTGRRCTYGNSEMVNIGFEIGRRFKEIYQVCVDVATQNPIYAKMTMQQPLSNVVSKSDTEWFSNGPPVDLDSMYDCSYQNSEISAILDKEFHRYDGCCFARRTLVNPKDVAPGLPQAATYTHLNVAPHWGTCNSKNWDDMEQRVRNLVIASDPSPLQVWTGTAHALQLSDALSKKKDVILNSRGKDVQVPMFFWKVVQDPSANASLAIIHVNVPDLRTRIEAAEYRLCTDVCKQTVWMRNRLWRDINRGYIYCCGLAEFENAFRYHGIFPRHTQLLKDVSFVSDSHYLHAILTV